MTPNFPVLGTSGKFPILVTDPSASHLAWCLCILDISKGECYIAHAGQLWTKDKWSRGQRYDYMFRCLEALSQGDKEVTPSVAVTEAFFMNPKLLFSAAVIPTVNAFIEIACSRIKAKYLEFSPTSWRGIVGIKGVKDAKGKKDYKVPTADYVKKFMKLPDTVPSNINRKERQMPHDVTDVLAMALAIAKFHSCDKIIQSNTCFMPVKWLEKFAKLSEEV